MKKNLPLKGLKVLDLSRLIPGPFCSLILSDLGADVTKLEDPERADGLKTIQPTLYFAYNRGKKKLKLSLTNPKDKVRLTKLIKQSDVLIESFRPGVLEKLGWPIKTLHKINSKLIIASITGYGQTGPLKNRAGHDSNYLGYAGLIQIDKLHEIQWADLVGGGMAAALNILAALWQRQKRPQRGRHLDISMTDTMSFMNMAPILLAQLGLHSSLITGALARYRLYKTMDERILCVAPLEKKFWLKWCDLINKPEWKEGSYPDFSGQIHQEMEHIIRQRTLGEWTAVMEEHDVCITPALQAQETAASAQFVQRKFYSTHTIDKRRVKVPRYPWK